MSKVPMTMEPRWFSMTQLRTMNAEKVRNLNGPAIVRGRADEPPLVVLVPYEQYLAWQEQIEKYERSRKEPR